jgi:hypothetical protein
VEKSITSELIIFKARAMDVKSFFVKCGNKQALSIRTHVFSSSNSKWTQTIFNTSDLIQGMYVCSKYSFLAFTLLDELLFNVWFTHNINVAYRSISALNNTPSELLSLYFIEDGVEVYLEPDTLVDELTTGFSSQTSLVLRIFQGMYLKRCCWNRNSICECNL